MLQIPCAQREMVLDFGNEVGRIFLEKGTPADLACSRPGVVVLGVRTPLLPVTLPVTVRDHRLLVLVVLKHGGLPCAG